MCFYAGVFAERAVNFYRSWLRTQNNQFLQIPRELVLSLPPQLQRLTYPDETRYANPGRSIAVPAQLWPVVDIEVVDVVMLARRGRGCDHHRARLARHDPRAPGAVFFAPRVDGHRTSGCHGGGDRVVLLGGVVHAAAEQREEGVGDAELVLQPGYQPLLPPMEA